MNFAAIRHESIRLFRQPVARNRVRFRLLTAREDMAQCQIIFWKHFQPEKRWTQAIGIRTGGYRTLVCDDAKKLFAFERDPDERSHSQV